MVPVPVVVPVPVFVPVVVPGHVVTFGSQGAGLGEPFVFELWQPTANNAAAMIGRIARM